MNTTNHHSPVDLTTAKQIGDAQNRPGSSQLGKSAFDWAVYNNRKTALQHLKENCTAIDTILETEDGSSHELVHSQVMSAFGDGLNEFINNNGTYVEPFILTHEGSSDREQQPLPQPQHQPNRSNEKSKWPGKVKLIRMPRLNKYTLNILVQCAYTGWIRSDLPSGGIWQVLEMADYYSMQEIIRACCTFLTKNLDRSNCVHLYHIGVKYKQPLERAALRKIKANFKHILAQNLHQAGISNQTTQGANRLVPGSPRVPLDPLAETRSQAPARRISTNSQRVATDATISSQQDSRATTFRMENNLALISAKDFEELLKDDRLNVDDEESVWYAIKLWCGYNPIERESKVSTLLPCVRFPRLKMGTDFSARYIWRDPLITKNKPAQHELAILDRNHRDYLAGRDRYLISLDGFSLPCATHHKQLRPRVPHSILLAIGGWQQGQPTTLIESYDVNCNLWFENKKKIMTPLAYQGVEYINGVLYICGGTDGSEILNELFTFDPIGGECYQKPSMRESRCYVSTAHLEGYLYAMGGHNGNQRMRSAERFNLKDEVWTHLKDMNVARSDASACVHESRIYVAGGLNEQVIESSVEFYNQQDDTWTYLSAMVTPRTSFTLLLFRGCLLAIGGNNGTERLASVEQYNFTTKIWSHHSNMRHKRSTFSAALVDDTKLIVVGGYNGQTPFNQVETYDEYQRCWVTLQKIRYDRSGLKAVVVSGLPNAVDYTFTGHHGYNASHSFGRR